MGGSFDERGHALSTDSAAAVAAYNNGVRSFVNWRTDTIPCLDAAIEADDTFAMARLGKAWILQTARSDTYKPAIETLLSASEPYVGSDPRERAYFDALGHAVQGRGTQAASVLETMLLAYPTDLFAHRLVQFELFWNGRAAWMCDIAERAAPSWNDSVPGFGTFLSVRAFANEELARYESAERYGRQAVELDASDVWGTHAVAHVLIMKGEIDKGVAWLEGLSGNWEGINQMAHHLWWHLSLFLLERGEHARILELLTSRIRNPDSPLVQALPDATIDIQNVASLLMRLDLRGVDVADGWQILAEICAGRVHNCGNPFSSAHDMMVLAATGRVDAARELLRSVREYAAGAQGSLATSYKAAGVACCEAVLAHRQGEHEQVLSLMLPIRHDLPLVGGSHAQRDIFYQIMVDSAHHCGHSELVPLLLDDVRRLGFLAVEHRTLYKDSLPC